MQTNLRSIIFLLVNVLSKYVFLFAHLVTRPPCPRDSSRMKKSRSTAENFFGGRKLFFFDFCLIESMNQLIEFKLNFDLKENLI
jgi:hypothetical protein